LLTPSVTNDEVDESFRTNLQLFVVLNKSTSVAAVAKKRYQTVRNVLYSLVQPAYPCNLWGKDNKSVLMCSILDSRTSLVNAKVQQVASRNKLRRCWHYLMPGFHQSTLGGMLSQEYLMSIAVVLRLEAH